MRRIAGFSVQTHRVLIRASGVVTEPECVDDPTDCCVDPTDGGNAADGCCSTPPAAILAIEVAGPLGIVADEVTFSGELELVPGGGSWHVGPLAGVGGPFAEGAIFEAVLYCLEGWWLEGWVIKVGGGEFRFQVSLLDDGEHLLGVIEVPEVGDVQIVIARPCEDDETVTECVVNPACGVCAQISSRYVVKDETATILDTLYLLAGDECRFRSVGSRWWLEYDSVEDLWRLSHIDGRTWELENGEWNCCETNTMISQGEWPDFAVTPTYECCPYEPRYNCVDGTCVEVEGGDYTSLGLCQAACRIETTCCEEVPSALYLHANNCFCSESVFALVYSPTGSDGAGWYSTNYACGEETARWVLYCNGEVNQWTLVYYCKFNRTSITFNPTCGFGDGIAIAMPLDNLCCDLNMTGTIKAAP